jgi:hypothetical protein
VGPRYVFAPKGFDAMAICNGILGGLVSIAAGCGSVEPGVNSLAGAWSIAVSQKCLQGAFCATAATIVSGSMAERTKLQGFSIFVGLLTSFLYLVVVLWGWSGVGIPNNEDGSIAGPGYNDFAGNGIVHMVGGVTAAAGGAVVGPRHGRWESPEESAPHNPALCVLLGTLVLRLGRYGFNGASTLALASSRDAFSAALVGMNTTLAPTVAGLVVFLLRSYVFAPKRFDVMAIRNAIFGGLVSIPAGCGSVEPGESIVSIPARVRLKGFIFVVENLWGCRKFLSLQEWFEIVVILFVFIPTHSVLILTQSVLTGLSFIRKYASVPSVNTRCTGGEISSSARREELVSIKMSRVAFRWVLVLGLKGYVFFFGSAEGVAGWVRNRMSQDLVWLLSCIGSFSPRVSYSGQRARAEESQEEEEEE